MEKYKITFQVVCQDSALVKRRNMNATLILMKVTSHTQSGSATRARCAKLTSVSGVRYTVCCPYPPKTTFATQIPQLAIENSYIMRQSTSNSTEFDIH